MIYVITQIVLGLSLFICFEFAYRMGLKHGKELAKGNIPVVNLNPVKAYKEHIETKTEKESKAKEEIYSFNFWNYDGEPQKPVEEVKK